MYLRTDVARQMHQEVLDQAQERRNAWRVSALSRARRRAVRAERRMSRARLEASRLRRELEAEL
jgi:DNA polymerase III delta prime subunit